MRNRFVLSVLLLVFASGLVWAQFWKNYPASDRQSLAEAYWLAGAQYQAVGEAEKGAQFKALARIIDPALDPAAIKDTALPSAAELLAQGRAAPIGAGASSVPSASLSSFFLRFVGSLLDQNSTEMLTFLDGSVYLTKVPVEVKSADSKPSLDAFFAKAPLTGQTASGVYDLESLVIAPAPQSMQAAWGETYTLNVNAKADYSGAISFWEPKQQFFIHRTDSGWHIFAVGQAAPPLSWTPQKAAAEAPAAAAPQEASGSERGRDRHVQGVHDRRSRQGRRGAVKDVAANIRFLRLRQTVTRNELKTTLLGSFDKADFPSAMIGDSWTCRQHLRRERGQPRGRRERSRLRAERQGPRRTSRLMSLLGRLHAVLLHDGGQGLGDFRLM